MVIKVYKYTFMLVNICLRGVLNQIYIYPKPVAVVNIGEDLTFTSTRNSSTWNNFYYLFNNTAGCFLTIATADPCQTLVPKCEFLHSYRFECDKIHFNLTISNVQRSMQNIPVQGILRINDSNVKQTDNVPIQVHVPLKEVTVDPNGMLTIAKGETKQLTCSAKSIPRSTLTWLLDDFPVDTSILIETDDDTVNSTYRYTARKPDNGKILKCTASYGSIAYTDNVTLDIQYLPSVEVKPSDYKPYKVLENTTDLQLRCSVNDTNPMVTSYRWYANNAMIQTKTANYTISSVQRSDAGDYSCDANNTVGTSLKSADVKLDVLFGITLDELAQKEVNGGSKLNVTCTGQANPPITDDNVIWTKKNNNTFTKPGRHLIITNINIADKGIFICTVIIMMKPSIRPNVQKSATTLLPVDVLYAPSVKIIPSRANLTVLENSTNIALNCNVTDSNPDATHFIWFKNEEPLNHHNRIFNISIVKKGDSGLYTCAATNIAGQSKQSPGVLLTTLYGVSINLSTTQIRVNETEQWSVIGKADGNPLPTFNWIYTHNDSVIQPLPVSLKESSITINNANCQDSGRYIVIGNNGIGIEVSRSFNVQIICAPREVMNRQVINVFIREDALHLEAVFIAYPTPNISWSLMENTTELGSEYNISNLETGYPYKTISILSKVNNKHLDRGKYYATSVNELGSQTVTFNIADKDEVQNQVSDSPSTLIGGISAAAVTVFVAVAVILTLYLIRRWKCSGNKRDNLVGTNTNTDEENDDYGLKDNPLYVDSKAVHSGVLKKNGDNKKGVYKFKSKPNENNKDMVYENSAGFLELDDSNRFPNSVEDVNENKTSEPRKVNKPHKNKDGLIYADLDLDQSKKKFVIHGIENRTNYAFIDHNQSAEPLPSSDEDEVNKNEIID